MFEAIYYPYSSIENEQTLKRCLFYLDKLYVLTPDECTISQNRSELERIERSLSDHNYRIGERDKTIRTMIEPVHPSETLNKYEREFVDCVKEDLRDDKFRELSGQEDCWMLYNDKIPRLEKIGFKDNIRENGGRCVKVDRDFGESILINHVIYACLNKKISPLTDEIEHNRVLSYKIKRNYDTYKDFLYEQGYIEDLKEQVLMKTVVEKHLYGLENVEISDIIDYRKDHKRELKRFTVEMNRISSQIKSKPFDLEFESEISQIISDKIDPSIEALNTSMQDFRDEMVKKYVSKIAPVALTFSVTATSAGLEVGALSAGLVSLVQSITHKDGMELIGTLLDHWQQNRQHKRNSLQYLVDAEKRFNA